ncbi:Uncharacterised protein [uncultured archaeon]|nr:Uncharacterised protein [uncultured archaeon]
MKKVWLLLLLIPLVSAYSISDWPSFFVKDGKFSALYVIAEEAPALDVVSATVISTSLAKYENVTTEIGTSKLDTEIADITVKNAIVIGSPCDNRAAYQLMAGPEPCNKDLAGSVGYIKLFENNGKVQLLVTGISEKDRHAAAKFLANANLKIVTSKDFVVNSNSGSVPLYFEKKNQSMNVSVNKTVVSALPVSVSNVSSNVSTEKNLSSPSRVSKARPGPYQPLEELPQQKGFWSRLWGWLSSLFW